MFSRKLKIVQIATTCTDNFWYTVGLGNDGRVYLWDKWAVRWILNHQEPSEEQKRAMEEASEAQLKSMEERSNGKNS